MSEVTRVPNSPYGYALTPDSPLDHIQADTLESLPVFDTHAKNTFLEFMICGADIAEACRFVGIKVSTYNSWRATDPTFRDYAVNRIGVLRRQLSGDLLKAQFTRNMAMALTIDKRVLMKAAITPKEVTDDEWAYVRSIRKLYGAEALASLIKATANDEEGGRTAHVGNINVYLDGRVVTDEVAQQAASRQLLKAFITTGQIIEGESTVLD